ncbi:uncharacterized protein ASPGLDRAFT_1502666, partial [Aspergillus glaucus CBS 516.65]
MVLVFMMLFPFIKCSGIFHVVHCSPFRVLVTKSILLGTVIGILVRGGSGGSLVCIPLGILLRCQRAWLGVDSHHCTVWGRG